MVLSNETLSLFFLRNWNYSLSFYHMLRAQSNTLDTKVNHLSLHFFDLNKFESPFLKTFFNSEGNARKRLSISSLNFCARALPLKHHSNLYVYLYPTKGISL